MSFFTIVLTTFVATILVTVHAEDVALPAGVKTCKKDSNDYSSCLRLAIQESWPVFVQGIPELNVPSLDPFVIEYMENDYEVGNVLGKIVTKNVRAYGISKSRFLSVKPRHENNRFSLEVDFEMPKVFIEGDYKAEGKIGSFKLAGKGKFNISMEEVRSILELEGPVVNDKWILENLSLSPEVGKMKVWASDLFNGNQELTRTALAFVNEYWPILYHGMLPFASESWNAYLGEMVGNIFAKLSFARIFP